MPEGHTVHRTARHFSKHFLGKPVDLTSPQGRFTDSKLVSGQALLTSEAFGKQLYLGFESATVRIHLGIYGKWRFRGFEDTPPEPVGQVRARFLNADQVADVVGPTSCEVLDQLQVLAKQSKLGPDPLRIDPGDHELQRFLTRVAGSKVVIGQLLMDQSVIAGVGNVYRAELLFRAGLNPYTPGHLVASELVAGIWFDAVTLMRIGVKTGIMLTRDGYLKGRPAILDRYSVYKREGLPCRNCSTPISIQVLNSRKLYWCSRCQGA
ncbi:MAG: Fpg/Nei family DNA glycosylase [Aquiluna sp.]|jgi:endonuclease-8|nr:Fpg/Nei family DNA glycosylase [Aquiluna sp.]